MEDLSHFLLYLQSMMPDSAGHRTTGPAPGKPEANRKLNWHDPDGCKLCQSFWSRFAESWFGEKRAGPITAITFAAVMNREDIFREKLPAHGNCQKNSGKGEESESDSSLSLVCASFGQGL